MAAVAGAALLALPATAHAAETPVHTVSLPFLWPRAVVDDIEPDGAGGVWIAGGQGAYCISWIDHCALYSAGNPVVRRWTGSSWKEYPINGWTGEGVIARLASAGGQTWIGGSPFETGNSHFLAKFDGSSFQKVDKPSDAAISMLSTGAAGTWVAQTVSPTSDQPRLLRYDGNGWTGPDLTDRTFMVSDLQARTATDAWAVGQRNAGSATDRRPGIAHFDGTSWTPVTPPDLPGEAGVSLVRPIGEDDVWASTQKRLLHWDGDGWTVIAELSDGVISDLAIDASGTPVVATQYAAEDGIFRYTGGAWVRVAVPAGVKVRDVAVTGTSTIWGAGLTDDAPAVVSNF